MSSHYALERAAVVLGLFVLAWVIVRILKLVAARTWAKRIQRAQDRGIDVRRAQREKTVLRLMHSTVRYGVYGTALVAALVVATGGAATAFFGASLVVVIIGFGLQRLLGDMIAGLLLLFEGHFAVGDHLIIHQPQLSGVVEEIGLRTTVLRSARGDRVVVLNGSIVSFTRLATGTRSFALSFAAATENDARRAIDRAGMAMTQAVADAVVDPLSIDTVTAIGDTVSVHATVSVLPSFSWVVRDTAVRWIEQELGDAGGGGIDVSDANAGIVAAWKMVAAQE